MNLLNKSNKSNKPNNLNNSNDSNDLNDLNDLNNPICEDIYNFDYHITELNLTEINLIGLTKKIIFKNILKKSWVDIFYGTYNKVNFFSNSIDLLPEHITHIQFNNYYDYPITKLPKSLIFIKFGFYFNQKVDNLSDEIKFLILGNNFTQDIDNLPSNLEYLYLDSFFNNYIDFLPSKLNKLFLGWHFNKPINNLPNSLEYLFINSYSFNHTLDCLPPNLDFLYFQGFTFNKSINNLPDSIQYLTINAYLANINKIPKNTKMFETSIIWNKIPDILNEEISEINITSCQKNLIHFNSDIICKFKNLKKIDLFCTFDTQVNWYCLPNHLDTIILNKDYDFQIDYIPTNIKTVYLYSLYRYKNFVKKNFPNVDFILYNNYAQCEYNKKKHPFKIIDIYTI